jgi:hypothetical protein
MELEQRRTGTVHHAFGVLAEGTGRYAGINPALNASVVMIIFIALLFLVTRLNRDK